jgi:hypothetical protein
LFRTGSTLFEWLLAIVATLILSDSGFDYKYKSQLSILLESEISFSNLMKSGGAGLYNVVDYITYCICMDSIQSIGTQRLVRITGTRCGWTCSGHQFLNTIGRF